MGEISQGLTSKWSSQWMLRKKKQFSPGMSFLMSNPKWSTQNRCTYEHHWLDSVPLYVCIHKYTLCACNNNKRTRGWEGIWELEEGLWGVEMMKVQYLCMKVSKNNNFYSWDFPTMYFDSIDLLTLPTLCLCFIFICVCVYCLNVFKCNDYFFNHLSGIQ